MKEFFDLILNYIKSNYIFFIIGIMIFILLIVFIIFTKKLGIKKIITLVSLIPSFVAAAESVYPEGFGLQKHQIVYDMFHNVAVQLNCVKYLKYIDLNLIIEDVLKAPQKKGVVFNGKSKENETQ